MPVQSGTVPTRWERSTAAGLCTVEIRVAPAGAFVRLSGQLCYSSSPAVRRRIIETLASAPIRRLDLRGLTFVDLSGIDALGDILFRIGSSDLPEVHLGWRARRLLDLLTRLEDTGDAQASPAGLSTAAAIRAVATRGRRPHRTLGAPGS